VVHYLRAVPRRLSLVPGALLAIVVALALGPSTAAPRAAAASTSATFHVQPSVNMIAVTNAQHGAAAVLVDGSGKAIARRSVDDQGSVLFRSVPAGTAYVVRIAGAQSPPVRVVGPGATPPASFYASQHLAPGFGYLETRDGTLLSIDVVLPGPVEDGPYPTVVEYSGYDPSNPDGHQPASGIAQMLGFATVGVNLRGTGCSGGVWDYFDTIQALDGYDAIETVAAQPWVANGKVGMVGISYPGITQLYVARTRPPHLAAIAPLSVIDDTYATLFPGGIFNRGFALGWAEDRQASAAPQGQAWAARRMAQGDTTCAANQALRLQTRAVVPAIRANRFVRAGSAASLVPASFVHEIDVPVFIAGSWQDEETGSHFADMLDDFAPSTPLRAIVMNGVHADSFGPTVLSQWIEFLDIYVAHTVPAVSPVKRAVADALLAQTFGAGAKLAPDRFAGRTDYDAVRSEFAAEPRVQVLFDVGAGSAPGAAVPAFSTTATAWPLPGTVATTLQLGNRGTLAPKPPASKPATGADEFDYDPGAYPPTSASAERFNRLAPSYDWKPVPAGKAVAYVSDPLPADTVMAGTASADLWIRATAPDVDLEVTITEVRPDGQETYVQSGWLRASQRKLDERKSSELLPVQTHAEPDAAPLPRGRFTLVRVPIYPFAHAFRAGSRIRVVVQPPGGNRPAWAFAATTYDHPVTVEVAHSSARPSRIVLPVVPGIAVPTPLPACGTLRGQPCRVYEALDDAPAGQTGGSRAASGGSS
jgi:uncharacterized protein